MDKYLTELLNSLDLNNFESKINDDITNIVDSRNKLKAYLGLYILAKNAYENLEKIDVSNFLESLVNDTKQELKTIDTKESEYKKHLCRNDEVFKNLYEFCEGKYETKQYFDQIQKLLNDFDADLAKMRNLIESKEFEEIMSATKREAV